VETQTGAEPKRQSLQSASERAATVQIFAIGGELKFSMQWSKRKNRSIVIIIIIIILFELKEILALEELVSPCPVSVVASMDSRREQYTVDLLC